MWYFSKFPSDLRLVLAMYNLWVFKGCWPKWIGLTKYGHLNWLVSNFLKSKWLTKNYESAYTLPRKGRYTTVYGTKDKTVSCVLPLYVCSSDVSSHCLIQWTTPYHTLWLPSCVWHSRTLKISKAVRKARKDRRHFFKSTLTTSNYQAMCSSTVNFLE